MNRTVLFRISLVLAIAALAGCVQSPSPSHQAENAPNADERCASLFSGFVPARTEKLHFSLGYMKHIPDNLRVIKDDIDLDEDGHVDRLLLSREGRETDVTEGPYSNLLVVGRSNPAYSALTLEIVGNLFKPEHTRNPSALDYNYLSFAHFLYFEEIRDAKARGEVWGSKRYQEFFRTKKFLEELTGGEPVDLGPTLAEVGSALGHPYLLLSAKPIQYAEDGNALFGYDKSHRYIGPYFQFLATYRRNTTIDLICARKVTSTP